MTHDSPLRYEEVEIGCSAAECFRLLCDVARVPDWVPGVANVEIERFDAAGRALVAHYIGMPGRGSVAYSVMYAYDDEDDDALNMRWSTADRAMRDMDGEVTVSPRGEHRCSVRYGLRSSSTPAAPAWASASLEGEAPRTVLESFRRWAKAHATDYHASD